jgi:hypothetical protein
MGGTAERKYKRKGFVRQALIAGGVVGLILVLTSRRNRR